MKKNLLFMLAAGVLSAAAMGGCSDTDEPTPNPSGSPIKVKFASNIQGKSSIVSSPTISPKMVGTQWEATDDVGLYMKKTGEAFTAANAVLTANAVLSAAVSGALTPDAGDIFYPLTGNVDFVAYYPHTATPEADYTIPVSVAGQSTGLPTEVLYAKSTNVAAAAEAVTLTFGYSLAKITVNVTAGTGTTLTAADYTAMTVTVNGMYTAAKLALADGTLAPQGSKESIALHKASSTATNASFDALVLPAAGTGISFTFNIQGTDYATDVTDSYASGKAYTLNFAIDNLDGAPNPVASLISSTITARTPEADRSYTVDLGVPSVPQPPETADITTFMAKYAAILTTWEASGESGSRALPSDITISVAGTTYDRGSLIEGALRIVGALNAGTSTLTDAIPTISGYNSSSDPTLENSLPLTTPVEGAGWNFVVNFSSRQLTYAAAGGAGSFANNVNYTGTQVAGYGNYCSQDRGALIVARFFKHINDNSITTDFATALASVNVEAALK
jgi:hypothetical protein